MAALMFPTGALNSGLSVLQSALYGRAIAETKLEEPPLFIIGHWRSGTTFLHELLVLDSRFAFPTTYECFAPTHCLVSQGFLAPLIGLLLPARRPTDDMEIGFDLPQEDEFALISLGAPTPMRRLAFPNEPPLDSEFLDMEGIAEDRLQQWRGAVEQFVRLLTYRKRKPLVLKSPPHTGRIALLADMFPGARFIHLARDPFALFASTRRLWQALEYVQGLQVPRYEHLEEYILDSLERMYRAFHRQRALIDSSHICDVQYEQLAHDPIGQLEYIYDTLDLGDFEAVRPRVEASLEDRRGYRPSQHHLTEDEKQRIRCRWAEYIETYGYAESVANA